MACLFRASVFERFKRVSFFLSENWVTNLVEILRTCTVIYVIDDESKN